LSNWCGRAARRYVEAPFSGSKPGAETRRTVYYLGGEPAAVDRAHLVLSRLSQQRLVIGTGAQAALLKLVSNLQIVSQLELLCETLRWARAAGVSDDTFFNMLRGNMAWSGVYQIKEPKLRAGDFTPQFAVRHMLKDVRLALAAAPPACRWAKRWRRDCRKRRGAAWAGEDISVLYRLLEP
jgi:3-hydroxyisobutyrate dehydrogenase-like beta-hydroxyacid dehydrogenase